MSSQKIVLITGASSGIGKSIAEYLHQKDYKVYGTSRNPERYKVDFELLKLDVCNQDSIEKTIQYILSKSKRIDVLINNAGAGITGPLEETDSVAIKNNFETNFFGPIEMMKAVLPSMRHQKTGLIINVTSIAGYMGLPFRGVYSASKGALELITESLRMEVKNFGINITNIAPGDFATNIAVGRYHSPIVKGSDYEKMYADNLDLMNQHVNNGADTALMAKAVYKIINLKNPKIHYKIGSFLQKFSIILKRVLPDLWYEKMLMNHYKLK